MGRTSQARERLIEGAMELLYTLGYRGAGVDELCRRAGVQKGSFYHFFPSKQELAVAAIDARWAIVEERLLQPLFGSGAPPLERIRAFFDATVGATAAEKRERGQCGGCPFGNLAAEMGTHDEALRLRLRRVFEDIAGYFATALREEQASGRAPAIDPELNARALVAYMEGMLLIARTYDDPGLMGRIGQGALAVALTGEAGP